MPGPEQERQRMVERQLAARGIDDEAVLRAMGEVPRERFVRPEDADHAYADAAMAIGCGQTISQPWIVAAICQGMELTGSERVLEIGTGSGYSAAILARLAAEVVSIERIAELADRARQTLAELDLADVEVICGDGSLGAPDRPPFDAIAVHAAAPGPPGVLLEQLAAGGRLVAPVATGLEEVLTRFRRSDEDEGDAPPRQEPIARCRFVPLIGSEGYPESGA